MLCTKTKRWKSSSVPCSGRPGSPGRRGMTGFRGPPGFVGRPGVKGKRLPIILCSHSPKLISYFTSTTTSICTADTLTVFDPQDRKGTMVTRESEDPRVLWDTKEEEASKVSKNLSQVPGL